MLSDDELARVVQAYHAPPEGLEQRANGYWFAHCGCGYLSARRRTPQLAAEALIHHMRTVGKQLVANGVSVPSKARAVELAARH
jgi:hypothetical protein